VLGFDVAQQPREVRLRIGYVFGGDRGLYDRLSALDNLRYFADVYRVAPRTQRTRIDELLELVALKGREHERVETYSRGMRQRLHIARGLLHDPPVLFLDEPTIGLDVTMQGRIRRFVAEYNRRTNATILLTSHYMDDVVALCKRVIVIHHGHLLYDGALSGLAERMAPYKLLRVTLSDAALGDSLAAYGDPVEQAEGRVTLRVPREEAPERTARLIQDLRAQVLDLTLEDPAIEEVIDRVFSEARAIAAP
jgi:ABC-2 type transport system ATP-binding protein